MAGDRPIAYVVDRYPELSQTFVHDEIMELRRQGQRVMVIALREGNHNDGDHRPDAVADPSWTLSGLISLVTIAARHPRRCLRVARLLRSMDMAYARVAVLALPQFVGLLENGGIRRVHAHFAWGASSVAAYLAAYIGVPLSITVHARDLYVDPQNLPAKFRAADTIVTVCEYNRDWLATNGCPPAKIAVIPCGVTLPPEVTFHHGEHSVIGVGRLVPKKGFDTLIVAASQARLSVPDLRITIIGDGPEGPRLNQLIQDLGLESTVSMMGAMDHQATLMRLAGASLFALPCRVDDDGDSDALPVVIREAMARAIPVVSTRVAGIPETVTSDCGWLVPSDDPRALARTIVNALRQPEILNEMGEAGRQRVLKCYTIDRSVLALRETLNV